jgi:outer membrane protein assembly factor BamD (BamD/ComL family)
MINNNTRFERIASVLLFLTLILSACTTVTPKNEVIKNVKPTVKVEPVLPITAIDKKISILEDLLTNNKIQEKDRTMITNLISDYHKIKVLSQGDQSQNDYKEIILTLFNDLSLLDENYFLSHGPDTNEIYNKAANDLYVKKQSILKKYIAKDYKAVISGCNELEKTFGKASMTYETGILLALSLVKDGRTAEAITVADKVIDDLKGSPDLIQLRAGLIEWRIKTEKKENALKEYQELVESMNEKQDIFDKITGKVNSQQNKNVIEPDQSLNNIINKTINADTNTRITSILKEVDNLKTQGDFTGARQLLLKWKTHTNEVTELTEIDNALKTLDLSEKQYQENLKINQKEGIKAAAKLIEEEEYESAINMLDKMQSGGDSNPDLDQQKNIAVEKLINKERNRAAKIFLNAKKTEDTKKKETLLLSAQSILNGLIERYPSSGSIEKLKSNLNSINNELKKIGK